MLAFLIITSLSLAFYLSLLILPYRDRRKRHASGGSVYKVQTAPPINIEAGALGKYSLNGVVSGIGLFQNNAVSSNESAEGAFSNAQLFFQKTTGWFQFYVQAGAYDIVALGAPFISNVKPTATFTAQFPPCMQSWYPPRTPTS